MLIPYILRKANMTKDQYIIELKAELGLQLDWAGDLSDEYLEGDPEVRKEYAEDRQPARSLLSAMPDDSASG